MNNQIDRDIFVLTDTLKDPIFYVRGTNSIPIVFHFRDFTIPSDSQAYYYVKKPSGKSSFNLASQLSNTVTVDVKDQDFSELGFCHLQIQIVSGEKTLVSFDQPVVVKENYTDGQSEESKNESNAFVLQNQGIENSGKFLGIDETGNVVPRYAPGSGTGSTVSVSVSETTTGEPGTDANVENVGDSQNVKLKFTIPKGDKGEIGEDGKSAYQIWTEQEGNSGKSEEDFLLSLKGEKGNPGEDGKAATIRIGSVTTGDTAQVTNSGTETDAVFDFVIPQGGSGGGTPSDYETVKSNSKKIWIDETLSYSIESNKQDIFGAVETSKALKLQITDGSEYWDADEKSKYPDVLSMEEIRKSRFYKNMWLPNSLEMVQSYRYSADKNGQIRLYDINAQKTDLTGLMPWGLCLRAEGKEYPTSQTHFILSKFKCLGLNSETGAWEMIQESAPTASLFDIAHTSTEGHVLQVDRTDLENGFYSFVIRMPSSWVIDGEDMCFHFYPESGISSEIVKNYDKIIVTFLLKVLEEENSGIFTCSAGCDAIGSSSDVEAFFSRFNPVTTELREHCANNCLSEESELISDNLILINECLYGSTPSVQGISQATETTLGGIRAKQRTTESVEAAIDQTSGKIYVPDQGTPSQEQISEAVNQYLSENPVQAGATTEQAQQIEKNKNDISQISEEIDKIVVSKDNVNLLGDGVVSRKYTGTNAWQDYTQTIEMDSVSDGDNLLFKILSFENIASQKTLVELTLKKPGDIVLTTYSISFGDEKKEIQFPYIKDTEKIDIKYFFAFDEAISDDYLDKTGVYNVALYVNYDDSKKLRPDVEVSIDNINGNIPNEKLDILTDVLNQYNSETSTQNKSVDEEGNIIDTPNYSVSDFIKIIGGAKYRKKYYGTVSFYDSSKQFLSNVNTEWNTEVTAPSLAEYAILTIAGLGNELLEVFALSTADNTVFYPFGTQFLKKELINEKYFYKWYGKKFASFGHSLVAMERWQGFVSDYFGMEHTNCGVGGSKVSGETFMGDDDEQKIPMWKDERINQIPEDTDLLLILCGKNDYDTVADGNLGDIDSSDTNTFYGAYQTMLDKLYSRCPKARVIIMTDLFRGYQQGMQESVYESINEAIRNIAKKYNYPVIDCHEYGFNQLNYTVFYEPDDPVHPSIIGGKRIADVVIGKLKMYNPIYSEYN